MQGYIFIPECTDKYEKAGKQLAGANGIFDSLFIDYDNAVTNMESLPATSEDSDNKCIFVGNSWKANDEVCSWKKVKASLVDNSGWTEDDFITEVAKQKESEKESPNAQK